MSYFYFQAVSKSLTSTLASLIGPCNILHLSPTPESRQAGLNRKSSPAATSPLNGSISTPAKNNSVKLQNVEKKKSCESRTSERSISMNIGSIFHTSFVRCKTIPVTKITCVSQSETTGTIRSKNKELKAVLVDPALS